jgi:nucleoside-diphosphate-sugar epimerase
MAAVVAITGANGFLGRHTVKRALEKGISVRGIVRRKEAADLVGELGATTALVTGLNEVELTRALEGCSAVIHFAGIVSERYGSLKEINVGGTRALLRGARLDRLSRFVVPTGLGINQYGKKTWATNDYFDSKRRIENLCKMSQVPHVIFRPSYIIGPGDELIPIIVTSILKGKVLVVEEGNTPMQPLYVVDAANSFLGAATRTGLGRSVYDLVGPETVTLTSLVPRVAEIMREGGFVVPDYRVVKVPLGMASEVLGLSREEVEVMLSDVVGDPGPLVRDFRIELTPLDEAIRSAVEAFRDGRIV